MSFLNFIMLVYACSSLVAELFHANLGMCEALGASWNAHGMLGGASVVLQGASGTPWGGPWELQGRSLERLGVL